jgi:hypothetical protein
MWNLAKNSSFLNLHSIYRSLFTIFFPYRFMKWKLRDEVIFIHDFRLGSGMKFDTRVFLSAWDIINHIIVLFTRIHEKLS